MSHLARPLIKSSAKFRRSLFVARLSLLIFVVTGGYALVNWLLGFQTTISIYFIFMFGALCIYFLNRVGKTQLTKVTGLLIFNSIVYIVASSEPLGTGMSLYFFTSGAVALTIYDFDEWPISLFFAFLSTTLYLLVNLDYFSVLPERNFTQDQVRLYFAINTVVNGLVCIYSFLMFSKLNFDSKNNLRENEVLMRRQNEKLAKANLELDRFIYSVSHDLRAPLSSISGLIQLAEKSSDPKEAYQYLDLMKGRIVRLDQFIRDIIDFSRNARSDANVEKVNVKRLVQETFEDLKFINGLETLTFQNQLSDSLDLPLDKMRLQIVLANLISNAIHYRNNQQDKPYVRLSGDLKAHRLTLKIEDNGIGIDAEHHMKVFNMFYRASENSKGSGLGLYIVKETMEKLGGCISLHSVLGKGTLFTLELPVQRNLESNES